MAETFGEDPLVNANMGSAHVRGLQGGSGTNTYLKAAATCKVRLCAAVGLLVCMADRHPHVCLKHAAYPNDCSLPLPASC